MLVMLTYWAEVYVLKKKPKPLVVTSMVIGLVVNFDRTKYVVISGDKNAGRMIRARLREWSSSDIWEQHLGIKVLFSKKLRADEVRECLLSFGAESFVFHFAIQKYKE